jgi:hypothetical protein
LVFIHKITHFQAQDAIEHDQHPIQGGESNIPAGENEFQSPDGHFVKSKYFQGNAN